MTGNDHVDSHIYRYIDRQLAVWWVMPLLLQVLVGILNAHHQFFFVLCTEKETPLQFCLQVSFFSNVS